MNMKFQQLAVRKENVHCSGQMSGRSAHENRCESLAEMLPLNIGLCFVAKLEFSDFQGMMSLFHAPSLTSVTNKVANQSWEDVCAEHMCPCVGTEGTQIFLVPGKRVSWYWKLGVSMQRFQ